MLSLQIFSFCRGVSNISLPDDRSRCPNVKTRFPYHSNISATLTLRLSGNNLHSRHTNFFQLKPKYFELLKQIYILRSIRVDAAIVLSPVCRNNAHCLRWFSYICTSEIKRSDLEHSSDPAVMSKHGSCGRRTVP